MKKLLWALLTLSAVVLASLLSIRVAAQQGDDEGDRPRRVLRAALESFQEPPALVSPNTGRFRARISEDRTTIEYELTYGEFDTPVLFSHIHIGLRSVNGGITIFLCGGGGKPACPSPSGTVTGTATAADVLAIPAQGLTAGDLDSVLRAIRRGAAYVNVHTMKHPGGEIRGQITVLAKRERHEEQEKEH